MRRSKVVVAAALLLGSVLVTGAQTPAPAMDRVVIFMGSLPWSCGSRPDSRPRPEFARTREWAP